MRKRIIVGAIVGLLAVCFTLATDYDVIAFNEFRYRSPVLTFLYGLVNLPIIIVMSATSAGYSQRISTLLFFVWWFTIGFILCLAFEKLLSQRKKG